MLLVRALMVVLPVSAFFSLPFLPRAMGAPAAGLSSGGHAYSEVDCGVIEVDCLAGGDEHHTFSEDFPLESKEFQNEGYHGECLVCMDGIETVDPERCHPPCPPNDDEDTQLAYGQMLERARVGDIRGVAEAALKVPEYARLNEDRQSLQIVDCSKKIVVASLPLGGLRSEVQAMLRSALEQ